MKFREHLDPAIYFEGKSYPLSIYMQAYNAADRDPELAAAIDKIEKDFIRKHLEELMKDD